MLIANPIYDVVFKRLMDNEKVAKFFIGTFLEQDVDLLDLQPQEYTYEGLLDIKDEVELEQKKEMIAQRLGIRIFRMDFVATVRTKAGDRKKILIEVQKAQEIEDVMRFRRYLAEHYKGTEPEERKKIADEEEAWRTISAYMEDLKRKAVKLEKELAIKEKVLEEKDKVLEEKDKVLEENAKVLQENAKVLQENAKALSEKDKLIQELLDKLNKQT